jgi:DNA-binding NarL/FixJ family response regulator
MADRGSLRELVRYTWRGATGDPQEVQVARLAPTGQTNPEIGAQLFLSPRTVEWHLGKVFGKLGISFHKELASALPDIANGISA